MNDIKIPVFLLIFVLAVSGYFIYDKIQNPKPKVRVSYKRVEEPVEDKKSGSTSSEDIEKIRKDASKAFEKADYTATISLLNKLDNIEDYDAQHMLGFCYSQNKEYDRAIVAFEKAIKHKKMPIDGYSLGYLYELTGRYTAAVALYEELASAELPPNLRRSVLEGLSRISAYLPESSRFLKYCKELAELNPESSDGCVNLFRIMRATKNFSGIDDIVEKTSKHHENNYRYNYELAQLYDDADRVKEAVKFYKKCLKIKPEVYTPFMDCYKVLTRANEHTAAVKALEYFLDGGESHPSVFFEAALEASRLKKFKTAVRLYIHAVCNDEKLLEKNDEGLVKAVERDYQEKGTELEKSFINAFICYLNGDSKYADSELKRIKDDIQNSIYKEDFALVEKSVNKLLSIDKRYEAEEMAYKEQLRKYEEDLKAEEASKRLKAKLAEKNKIEKIAEMKKLSDADLKKAAMQDSNSFDRKLQIGDEFVMRANYSDAKFCYRIAMNINNKSSEPHLKLARVYYMEKNLNSASTSAEEGLKLEPDNIDLLSFASTVFAEKNDVQKAVYYAEKAFSIDSSNSQTILAYARACMLNNNFSKANELVNFALEKEKNNINRATLLNLKRKISEAQSSSSIKE